MATTRYYLDTRCAETRNEPVTLRLAINHRSQTAYINIAIKLSAQQWDAHRQCCINHPRKQFINQILTQRKLEADEILMQVRKSGRLRLLTARQLKDEIAQTLFPDNSRSQSTLFIAQFEKFASRANTSRGTQELYHRTIARLRAYCAEIDSYRFEDITAQWLKDFDAWLAQTSPRRNARNIHLRNIRAVFNAALQDEITTAYPFRRFKLKNEETAKRSLTLEQLSMLIQYPCEQHLIIYRDIFLLSFYLLGINIGDLCSLRAETADGRIEFNRKKTHRLYSIKVEAQAQAIIDKYRGRDYLLCIGDAYKDYKNFTKRLNIALKHIGKFERIGRGGRKVYTPLIPGLTSYWARHTWATLAAELDIPKETIAAALGHGGKTVTDVYINFDRKKVEQANQRVIAYVEQYVAEHKLKLE
jgi:site-specific recombinase XerD